MKGARYLALLQSISSVKYHRHMTEAPRITPPARHPIITPNHTTEEGGDAHAPHATAPTPRSHAQRNAEQVTALRAALGLAVPAAWCINPGCAAPYPSTRTHCPDCGAPNPEVHA